MRGWPATPAALPADLTQLSLNELLSIEVSSVSKRIEPLAQAAAAIFVLTDQSSLAQLERSLTVELTWSWQ